MKPIPLQRLNTSIPIINLSLRCYPPRRSNCPPYTTIPPCFHSSVKIRRINFVHGSYIRINLRKEIKLINRLFLSFPHLIRQPLTKTSIGYRQMDHSSVPYFFPLSIVDSREYTSTKALPAIRLPCFLTE